MSEMSVEEKEARRLAEEKLKPLKWGFIYECSCDMQLFLRGMLDPEYTEMVEDGTALIVKYLVSLSRVEIPGYDYVILETSGWTFIELMKVIDKVPDGHYIDNSFLPLDLFMLNLEGGYLRGGDYARKCGLCSGEIRPVGAVYSDGSGPPFHDEKNWDMRDGMWIRNRFIQKCLGCGELYFGGIGDGNSMRLVEAKQDKRFSNFIEMLDVK